MLNRYRILCTTKEERDAALSALKQLKYRWMGSQWDCQRMEEMSPFEKCSDYHKNLSLNSGGDICFSDRDSYKEVTLSEFFKDHDKSGPAILVGGRATFIDYRGVSIGCQLFEHGPILELAAKIQEIKGQR